MPSLLLLLLACADDKAAAPDDSASPDDSVAPDDSAPPDDSTSPDDSGDSGDPTPLARWSGDQTLDDADHTVWLGEAAGHRLGRTVMRAGDADGDGYEDAALGAYYWSDETLRKGRAWLISGPIAPGDGDLDAAVLTVTGEAETEFVSRSLSSGDVDADGLADLIVGSPNHGDGVGRAGLWRGGRAGSLSASEADALVVGSGGLFGAFTSSPGDLDGDGLDDLLISSIFGAMGGASAGEVRVLPGPLDDGVSSDTDAPATRTGAEGDEAGWFTAAAGDLDGDGYDDAWVGAPNHDAGGTDAGAVWLLRGPVADGVGALSDVADAAVVGDEAGGQAGRAVAGGQDLDGDGGPDLLIGGPSADAGNGAAWVLLSPPSSGSLSLGEADLRLAGEVVGGVAGWAVGLPGDLDRDGYGELMIGVYGGESGTVEGRASLFYGPPAGASLSEADATFLGGEIGDFAGWFLSGAGDLSGDGAPDLLIGAQRSDRAGDEAGRAHLVAGAP